MATLQEMMPEIEKLMAAYKGGQQQAEAPGVAPKGPCAPCADKATDRPETYRLGEEVTNIEIVGPDGETVTPIKFRHYQAEREFQKFLAEVQKHNQEADETGGPRKGWHDVLDSIIFWVDAVHGVRITPEQADWIYDTTSEIIAKKKLMRHERIHAMQNSLRRPG